MKAPLLIPLLVPLGGGIGALYLWGLAGGFRGGVGRYEVLGPSFFPRLLLGALIAACAVQFTLGLVRLVKRPAGQTAAADTPVQWCRLALSIGVTIAYAAALQPIGFLVATPLFQVLLLIVAFRVSDWRVLVGLPPALTALFFLIFVVFMGIPLPRGRWIFAEFSRFFY